MSNFAALIATIQANIKTNGNEEITGAVLQDVLEAMVQTLGTEAINNLEMALGNEETARQNADGTLQNNIDAEALRAGTAEAGLDGRLDTIEGEIPSEASSSNKLADKAYVDAADTALANAIGAIEDAIENGYVYAGIATPSGTPMTGKVFYLALTAGTYTNFGGLSVAQGINVLKYNGTTWVQEQLIGLEDAPTVKSGNIVKSGGILEYYSTLGTTDNTSYQNYIRNVFVIPTTSAKFAWLKSLTEKSLKLSYLGVRNSNLGNGIFGIQLQVSGDSVGTFFTLETPDFSKGYIFELERRTNTTGEFGSGIRVFVEYNQNVDLTTPSGLINTQSSVFVQPINRTQLSLFAKIFNLPTELKSIFPETINRTVVNTVYRNIKNIDLDYRPLKNIVSFKSNLFDKSRVVAGYYANNGSYSAVSNYSAAKIPVPLEAGATYIVKPGDVTHIDILSSDDFSFIVHLTAGSTASGWNVTYNSTNNTFTFTVPSNLNCCMLVSCTKWNVSAGNVIVNKGTVIKSEKFEVSFGERENNYLVVDKKGLGDYTTLTAAADAAPDGSIIIVMPGIYDNEIVVGGKKKTLFIIGVDRDKCVIKNNDGDYNHSPIAMSSGLLRNLTVIEEATTTPNNGSYAVHADYNPLYNSTLRIENCTLRSNVPNTGAVGAGLRGGGTLTIKGCHLISGTSGRALYVHDNAVEGYDGEQWLVVEDCTIESPDVAVKIQGQGKTGVRTFNESQYYLEFVRNNIKGTAYFENWNSDVTITSDDFQGVMNLRLSDLSWGNRLSVFNAQ